MLTVFLISCHLATEVDGDIFIGDVGGELYEEVDLLVAGGNYGWPFREGPQCRVATCTGKLRDGMRWFRPFPTQMKAG